MRVRRRPTAAATVTAMRALLATASVLLVTAVTVLTPPLDGAGRPAGAQMTATAATGTARTLHVAAGAAPGGDGGAATPFATVNDAMAVAQPGDTVEVGPGRYPGQVVTVRSGTAGHPIRLVGTGAHLYADDHGRLLEVRHDHITVEGFELSNANIVVLVTGATGVRLERNWVHGAQSECIRLRYFATANTVVHNVIRECGMAHDEANGEAIYIGTAPEKLHDNPTAVADRSNGNLIWGNDIAGWGECVDIKEDADDNQIIENWCRGGTYASGAGLSSRARRSVFVNNWSTDHLGSGLQLAGDRPGDGSAAVVTGNVLVGNAQYGLKIVAGATPLGTMCGNVLTGNGRAPSTPLGAGADLPC